MSALRGLAGKFTGLAAATALFVAPACAQDASDSTQIAANTNDAGECTTDQQSIAPPEALALSGKCDAVIYFNENVSAFQAEAEADSLRHVRGYNVVAVAGFPVDGQIVVLRDGVIAGNAQSFTQSQMLRGQVGSLIMREMGHPATVQTASLTEASYDN